MAPRYNEDPVITNNIWKPGRIKVKYGETNPTITSPPTTKSSLQRIDFDGPNAQLPRYNEYFVLSLAVGKNNMMIQMVHKTNTTPIGQDRETLTL